MDAAGDGADFNAAAGSADVSAEGVLVLILDDDGEVGANLSGDGFGGKMEAGVFRDGDFDAAGNGFQMPVAVADGIAGDFDSAGSAAGFYVVVGTSDGDGSARGVGFNAAAGRTDVDGAGKRVGTKIAFDGIGLYTAGSAVDARVVPKIPNVDGAAGGFNLHGAIDVFDADFARRRVDGYGALDMLNVLRAAGYGDGEFGFLRNFNRVGNGGVAETAEILADADQTGALFDGGIVNNPFQFFSCATEEGARADFRVNVDFAASSAADADGAGAVGKFEAQGTGDRESALKRALLRRPDATSGERGGCCKKGR